MPLSVARARALLRRFGGLRLLVVGDVMLDHYIWGEARRLSPEAPVPVVEVATETYAAGGAANVAINAATLGARVTLAGHIGKDTDGRRLDALLAAAGVSRICPASCGPTIVKTRIVSQRQQLCRLDREAPPEAYAWPKAHVRRRLVRAVREADAVLLSDYAKGTVTAELVATLVATARAAGKPVALDPKPRHHVPLDDLDLLTPNRQEALSLADLDPPAGAAFPAVEVCTRLFARHRVNRLAITLGADGILLAERNQRPRLIPTRVREVFDVSGAGDTTIATLVLALAAGAGFDEAAHLANAAAGVVVGKLGTAVASPAEILARLD